MCMCMHVWSAHLVYIVSDRQGVGNSDRLQNNDSENCCLLTVQKPTKHILY